MIELRGIYGNENLYVYLGSYEEEKECNQVIKEIIDCDTTNIFKDFHKIKIEVNYTKNYQQLNQIKTSEKYKKEGFTEKEISMIREHDILFNINRYLYNFKLNRMYEISEILKL